MRNERLELYQKLEEKRKANVILYAASDRMGLETSIAPDVLPLFVKRWARKFTIWRGILSLVMVALSFKNLTVWLLPQVLYIVAATALLFAKKDFAEK
ncbi:MAG: hypothetical protein Pg6A_19310 [Termitinemataceae bacterium]|nr:MAG: hypothetical protein Pg6A_19310 [Termitinemataceae bacterium]